MSTESMNEIMNTAVWIDYVSPDGSRAWYNVVPVSAYPPMRFGNAAGYPEEQWFISAYDCKSGKVLNFAMKNIRSWKTEEEYCRMRNILEH